MTNEPYDPNQQPGGQQAYGPPNPYQQQGGPGAQPYGGQQAYGPPNPYQQQPMYAVPMPLAPSFTGKAVAVLVLYCFLYLPGLIANLVFLSEAKNVRNQLGSEPQGMGCLSAMLIVQAAGVMLFCVLAALGG